VGLGYSLESARVVCRKDPKWEKTVPPRAPPIDNGTTPSPHESQGISRRKCKSMRKRKKERSWREKEKEKEDKGKTCRSVSLSANGPQFHPSHALLPVTFKTSLRVSLSIYLSADLPQISRRSPADTNSARSNTALPSLILVSFPPSSFPQDTP